MVLQLSPYQATLNPLDQFCYSQMVSPINPDRIINQHIFWVTIPLSPSHSIPYILLAPSTTTHKPRVLYAINIAAALITVNNLMDCNP